uniref:Interleukin-1 receptor antagonist protein n=1 Tax=Otus sunia TaxID=257818 RepID=A0A8C8AEV4_9STRI
MACHPALTFALLFLCTEAEGFTLCHTPTLQTKVFQYRIWDVNQKSLYLRNDQLVAGHLQGANAALEGKMGMWGHGRGHGRHPLMAPGVCVSPEKVFWVPNRAFEPSRLPVILGIQNGTRCLASPPASQPTLQLQVADIRELPRAGEASAAFTFFRSYKDGLWRFESAANPGWFLCTSARGHQPLGLSRRPDATHLLDFYFQLC